MLGLNRGYTLLEVTVTLAIVGILATIAVPSFNSVVEKQRVRSAADTLVNSLALARSQAITRNTDVTVASDTSAANWQDGWSLKTATEDLRLEDGLRNVTISAGAISFNYGVNGRADTAVSFVIKPSSGNAANQRCVSLSLSGKPRNKEGGC